MTSAGAILRRYALRAGRTVRDTWLIAGVTLLLLLVVESAYRVQLQVRSVWVTPASTAEPPSPFEATDWAADYWIGHEKEEHIRWAPYVYWRNPTFQAPHASVDSFGHRVTPLPVPAGNGGPTVRIFFMGGSTTFGWYQRAAYTIPAEAARRLQSLLQEAARVEVTNFGTPGYTFTQEILQLILQLRAGARPDVVVFYDGINDVMATVQNRQAGLPQNERNREKDFIRGRQLDAERRAGLANDLRTVRRVAGAAVSRLQLARAIRAARSSTPAPPVPAESLAKSIVHTHAENAKIVEALAASYGFEPIYVWQPALLATRKRLTPREEWLQRSEDPTRVDMMRDVHRAVPMLIGPAMAPIAGDRFIDATDLFRDDPQEIFVDRFGHTYERANPLIVDTLMPILGAAVLRAASPAHGSLSSDLRDGSSSNHRRVDHHGEREQ